MGVIKKSRSLEAHFRGDAALPAPSPAALSGGLRCFLRPSGHTSPWTSCRGSDQLPQAHQTLSCRCPTNIPPIIAPPPFPTWSLRINLFPPPTDSYPPVS